MKRSILKGSAIAVPFLVMGGVAYARYLQPEPLLSVGPQAIEYTAKKGMTLSPYGYAFNNPINYTDSTGLYAWRLACPDIGMNTDRGFVIHKDDVFGTRQTGGGGLVGFDGQGQSACDDLKFAQFVKSKALTLPLAFNLASDCWDNLIKEIDAACKKEKKNPCASPPPQPPPGYAGP